MRQGKVQILWGKAKKLRSFNWSDIRDWKWIIDCHEENFSFFFDMNEKKTTKNNLNTCETIQYSLPIFCAMVCCVQLEIDLRIENAQYNYTNTLSENIS